MNLFIVILYESEAINVENQVNKMNNKVHITTQIAPTPIIRGEDALRILKQISPTSDKAKEGAEKLEKKYGKYFK